MTVGRAHRRAIVCAAAAAVLVAVLGGLATDIGPWYAQLRQPEWKPPDWLFAPAWTLIYGLTALSGYRAWVSADEQQRRDNVLLLFSVNAVLNVVWSLLFFRFRRPDWAAYEVVLLWLSILGLVIYLARWNGRAAILLVPYLLWVTFAAALNWAVVRLNGPFA
jgi:tryptophan-rich sensory protein